MISILYFLIPFSSSPSGLIIKRSRSSSLMESRRGSVSFAFSPSKKSWVTIRMMPSEKIVRVIFGARGVSKSTSTPGLIVVKVKLPSLVRCLAYPVNHGSSLWCVSVSGRRYIPAALGCQNSSKIPFAKLPFISLIQPFIMIFSPNGLFIIPDLISVKSILSLSQSEIG